MIENNPNALLAREGIKLEELQKDTREGIEHFNASLKDHERFPESEAVRSSTEELGQEVMEMVEADIAKIREKTRDHQAEEQEKQQRKQTSEKIVKKAEVTLDELERCRQILREDRQKKIESGEIKPAKKKTLSTRLRGELVRMAGMIPVKLKENTSVIARTRKALMRFLSELKEIWGLDKIKPIEKELTEKFDKMQADIEKKSETKT